MSSKKNKKIVLKLLGIIIVGVIGYYINEGMDYIRETPDVDIIMPRYLEDEHLPIIVENTGGKTLSNMRLKISSCYMDFNKTYYINELWKGQQATIEFSEERTLREWVKVDCSDIEAINLSKFDIVMNVYRDKNTNELVIPFQESTIDFCGQCFWTIDFRSDQLNKTFIEQTYSTTPTIYSFGDPTITKIGDNLIAISPITFSFLDERIIESHSR